MIDLLSILSFLFLLHVIGTIFLYNKQKKEIKELRKTLTKDLLEIGSLVKSCDERSKTVESAVVELSRLLPRIAEPNEIEKTEEEEIPLDETIRFPITKDMQIRFEDEQKSMPIQVLAYGQTNK